jgi:multiple sugar transport system permease protein
MKRAFAQLPLQAALIGIGLLTLAPLAWMISASFMPSGAANSIPPPLLPAHPTWAHYLELFTRLHLARSLFNSTFVAVASTVSSVLLNGMAGYAFAKLRFSGRERVFQMLIIALVIPAQVGMLPLFLLLKSMGLVNTMMGVIIPGMTSVFGIFMVRQYALGIPDELLDAARIDGASEFRIYWNIVMPALQPILATLAVVTFLGQWNDFMWPLIVLSDEAKYTLPVALANLVGEHVQDTELMMAGSVLTVLPALFVFLALQRYYMRGMLAGSLKG